MNKSRAELKAAARHNLLGNYGILILAYLIIQLISLIVSIPFNNMIEEGSLMMSVPRILLGAVGTILISLIVTVFGCSMQYMQLRLGRGAKAELKDMLYCFKNRPDKYIGFTLLMLVICVICMLPGYILIGVGVGISMFQSPAAMIDASSIILIVAVILLCAGLFVFFLMTLGWSQAVFLMLDHPNLKVRDAMRTSRQMMKGYKWNMFVLILSFIGLELLTLCTLGLAGLWVEPYVTQTMVEFYLELDLATNR